MNEYVWIKPSVREHSVPIGALVLASLKSKIKVKDDDNNEYWISPDQILRPMHPTSILGVDDMTNLGDLQEYSILRNLQIRYAKDHIYTYIGSILVAVNPYKSLRIYDKSHMMKYRKKKFGELPPHIFAVADHSYENICKNKCKMCVVVSGESGAGKTETIKFFLRYLAGINRKRSITEQQILDSNPVLEAFGNAKTKGNENSSRFGKYVIINFNSENLIESVQIKQYLLERSRIVLQNENEQNYHIFYTILSGMSEEEKQKLGLLRSYYQYLTRTGDVLVDEVTKMYDIKELKSALETLSFSSSEIWKIFEILSVILHIGNLQYNVVSKENTEAVEIINENEVDYICKLLEVSKQDLFDYLTKKVNYIQRDQVVRLLSKEEALDHRDAFVKKIYENLFNFIVEKINQTLSKSKNTSGSYLGLLDIFGFESFEQNSFEQLCINYANEKLQQFFIQHIFKFEQEQYSVEGIKWTYVKYCDNKDVLELIEGGPNSILSIINDQSKFPKATDQTMLIKMKEIHSDNVNFVIPKYLNPDAFGIKHYPGVVSYEVKNFLEKNHDSRKRDLTKIIYFSNNTFLKSIFAHDLETDFSGNFEKKTDTLVSKFKTSLDFLVNELNQCQPFFVRCIKPNETKEPQKFIRMLCCKQLRYSGMTETVRIRGTFYPIRYDYVQFVQRYRILLPKTPVAHKTDCKETTARICKKIFGDRLVDYKLGQTKIFLKPTEEEILESERDKALTKFAVVIQKTLKGWLEYRRYKQLKQAALTVEKYWILKRNARNNIKFNNGNNIKLKLTPTYKSNNIKHAWVNRLQAHIRGFLIRQQVAKKLRAKKLNSKKQSPKPLGGLKVSSGWFFFKKNRNCFSKKPLKHPLTNLVAPYDKIAAKALWMTILRYTRNISEPNTEKVEISAQIQMKKIIDEMKNIGNGFETTKESKTHVKSLQNVYKNWLRTPSKNIQKLYFIISHGIVRPELRDEIYCQMFKVIKNNPSETAITLAWELLNSCTGCFPPSDSLLSRLKNFIQCGSTKYASYCSYRLYRTLTNGTRSQPPCFTELDAIKNRKSVNLIISIADGTSTTAKIDSSTRSKELLNIVFKNINLKDNFGFSVILNNDMKYSPLGELNDFVLDSIAECEQPFMEKDFRLENLPWKLFLKKEIFSPCHDCSLDEFSTKLIYHQIIDGIKTSEYVCNPKDLGLMIAQLCYSEGNRNQKSNLDTSINSYVSNYMENFSPDEYKLFKDQVKILHQKMIDEGRTILEARAFIVNYAMEHWSLQFSKPFYLYGSLKNIKDDFFYHDPDEISLVVALNSLGILVIGENIILLKLEFSEIRKINFKRKSDTQPNAINIVTYEGTEISIISHKSDSSSIDAFYNLLIVMFNKFKSCRPFSISNK